VSFLTIDTSKLTVAKLTLPLRRDMGCASRKVALVDAALESGEAPIVRIDG
jgi:hypothetical protein